jgi:NADP-dependent 3-hydroxy acid dehydrogenase YdfG
MFFRQSFANELNMSNIKGFDRKIAIITGGSSGIGKACAERFVKEGVTVIIAAREEKKAANTVKELQSLG